MYQDVYLTTLDAVKNSLDPESDDAADDALLETFIAAASDMITQYCGRSFVPRRATRWFDARGDHINGRDLNVDEDLLAVAALTNGDGTTVTAAKFKLWPYNGTPKAAVRLLAATGLSWTYSTAWEAALAVDGVWGFHEAYASAWVDTLDDVKDAGGIDADVQIITVADADGQDGRYRTRFQIGQLLRINDEYLKVVKVETTTEQITVLRGQLGTTAAVHAQNADVYSYAPQRNVEQACIALALWLYRNKETQGDKIQFLDGTAVITNVAPSHIKDTLNGYVKRGLR